jgi:hypothetical protein
VTAATRDAKGPEEVEMKKQLAALLMGSAIAVLGIGSVAHADTNVTSSNSCEDCDTDTGNSSSTNTADSQVGQESTFGDNYQEGDNDADVDQNAQASSGDGVPGQVVGVSDSTGGDVNINASNSCEDCTTNTGNANAANGATTFVGQSSLFGNNVQLGDNDLDLNQAAVSSSGDGVTGQIIGVVTA